MAKFIEVHTKPLTEDGPLLLLQNLDDISGVYSNPGGGAVILLRDGAAGIGTGALEVEESYGQLRLMIGAAQGGIPMDTGGSYYA